MDCQMDSSVILRSGSETRRFHLACHLKQAEKGKRPSFKFQVSSFQFPIPSFKLCNVTCYQSALSACCAREAIITFFAELEQLFMAAGCRSPLMYCSTSPGLLNVKRRAAAGRQRS